MCSVPGLGGLTGHTLIKVSYGRKGCRQAWSGLPPPPRRCHVQICENGKHAVSMCAQEADLIQQELTTEVWLKPPERCLCVLHSHDRLHSVTACFLFDCLDLPSAALSPLGGAGGHVWFSHSCFVFVWWVSLTGGVLWRSPLSTFRVQCLYHITHLSLSWCK